MRKLKLEADELVVETFNPAMFEVAQKGTVHAHVTDFNVGCSIDGPCTRGNSCYAEECREQRTNSPIYRECYTPYVECGTEGWTCNYCGGPGLPTTICGE